MTCISRSSDFALYLEDFLIYEHHTSLQDYESVWHNIWPQNKCRSLWHFMVQWFCLISWRLFDVWTSYFRIMSQYVLIFDLKINKCRLLWPIFYRPVILPYILTPIWYMNTILKDYESVWQDVWPKNNCMSLSPIFHGSVILPYILKTVWCMNFILQNYELVWHDIWLKINVGHYDLYFMVQWFCLISRRLFAAWTSYFGIMSQYYTFDLKINVGHCDLYFIFQWFCLTLWKLIYEHHTLGLWISMIHCLT